MADRLVTASNLEAGLTVVAAITTELVSEIRQRHDLWPTATAAVGTPPGEKDRVIGAMTIRFGSFSPFRRYGLNSGSRLLMTDNDSAGVD